MHRDGRPARRDLGAVAIERPRDAGQHVRTAQELGDEGRLWPLVDFFRRPDLFDFAGAQDRDPVRDRQRLFLIMCYIDGCESERLLQLADLHPHLGPQLRVQIGQRLIEQQHCRFDDEHASDRDAL